MARAWARRELLRGCLVFVLLACANPDFAGAEQRPPQARSFPTPWLIVLPPRLVAGAEATLAVLDNQGHLVPNITIELSTHQEITTDSTGRAMFQAPGAPGRLRAFTSDGKVVTSAEVIVAVDPGARPEQDRAESAARVISYPRVLATRDRFTLVGKGFRTEADQNHISLNADPCLVLAASPASLVALPGRKAPVGDATLHVAIAGSEPGQFPVSVVLLEFTGPASGVNAGSAGQLILHARGTTQPLLLEVRNASPAIIDLTKGNVQRVKTSGGEENAVPVDVEFVTPGNYVVSARLVAPGIASPDVESARKRLAEAKKIAPEDWSARIDEVLSKLDGAPRDLPQIRAELRAMLDDKPAPPLASLLDSAWRELN